MTFPDDNNEKMLRYAKKEKMYYIRKAGGVVRRDGAGCYADVFC